MRYWAINQLSTMVTHELIINKRVIYFEQTINRLVIKALPYYSSGTPTNNGIGFNVPCYNRSRSNNSALTNVDSVQNGRSISDPHIIIDSYPLQFKLAPGGFA